MSLNKTWKSSLMWFTFLIGSLLFQEFILGSFLGYGGKYLFIFVGIFPLIVMGLLFVSTGPWRRRIADIYFVGTSFLFISQLLYYQFFTNLYSFHMLKKVGQMKDYSAQISEHLLNNMGPIFLLSLPLLLYLFLFRKKLCDLSHGKHFGIILAGFTLILVLAIHLTMGDLPSSEQRARDLYFYSNPLVESSREFGLMGALTIDLKQKAFGEPLLEMPIKEEPVEVVPEPDLREIVEVNSPEPVLSKEEAAKDNPQQQIEKITQAQILELDFAELKKERSSETLALMDEYFLSLEPTYTNEYTGLFKGYNLIFITAESFWWPAVDPQRTPTLYRMVNEGIHLENFYNPIWTVSTYDGEYVGLTGMLPKDGIWSLYKAAFNSSPQSLGWRMKTQGYSCYAYHNHTYTYYDRNESHANLGYDYKGLGSGVEVEMQWPESDLEMMEVTMEEYLDKEPFHVYYLTVSGHGGYSYSGNAMAEKNKAYVEGLSLSEEAASYLAANMELEHALSYLLEKLEEKGIAQRTLIVLNPDHIPYSLSEGALEELAGEFSREVDRYRSSAILYTTAMEKKTIKKPTSSLDLLPTIYNLLGLSYDSRLLVGQDVFSDNALVIFYNRSWISEKGYYDSRSGDFEALTGEVIPQGYVESINQKVREKFYFSGLILEEDYYAQLPEKAFLP